jgi:hypothetical protein
MEAHGHWCSMYVGNAMRVVVHIKYFLLLSRQVLMHHLAALVVLILPLSIHHSKSHGAWDKNIIILATTCTIWTLNIILLTGLRLFYRLKVLKLILLRVLVAIVCHVPAVRSWVSGAHGSFLIVAVQVLNVK